MLHKWKGFWLKLRESLFRFKLYLTGVRFYEWFNTSDLQAVYFAEYVLPTGAQIKFSFFQLDCTDLVLKRGRLRLVHYQSYLVKADFSENFPDNVKTFDKRCFFFNGQMNRFGIDEEMTFALILDIYLDFLKAQLKIDASGLPEMTT